MKEKWQPKLENVPQPIPTDGLLRKAVYQLYRKRIISQPLELMRDEHGIYGYRYGQFILVAKKELYGNIVSVHEDAVLCARMHHVGIVMWLASMEKFYWFNAAEIDYTGDRNLKGKSVMVNFNIRLGRDPGWK
jgi:hypothetical protein